MVLGNKIEEELVEPILKMEEKLYGWILFRIENGV